MQMSYMSYMSALLLPGRGKLGSMHRTYGEACTFLGRLKAISFPLVSPMIPHTRDSVTWFSRLGPGFWVSNLTGNQQGVSYSPWFRCVFSLLPYFISCFPYFLVSILVLYVYLVSLCFLRPYHITSPLPSLVTSFLTTLAVLFPHFPTCTLLVALRWEHMCKYHFLAIRAPGKMVGLLVLADLNAFNFNLWEPFLGVSLKKSLNSIWGIRSHY